jgi:hypothetical protein
MAGPFDYTIQQPDIGGSIAGGIKSGLEIGAAIDQREAADAAQVKQKEFQADYQNYISNPTFKTTADFIAKYPSVAEPFETSWNIRNKGQNDQIFGTGIQALNALNSSRPDVAMKLFDDQITAMENAGEDPKDFKAIRDAIERDPSGAKGIIGLSLASYKPEEFSKIAQTRRDEEKAPYELGKAKAESGIKQVEARYAPETAFLGSAKARADIKNTISMANDRADRLGLDRDRLNSDIDAKINELGQKASTLDDGAKKLVNDAVVASVAADQAAGQFLDLANQIDQLGGGYGSFATAAEFWANAVGNQDAMSAARREYVRLRNTQAIKNLPPGAASDADVAMALEGFPKETADAKTLSSFLRGTAKLSQIEAVNENAKSEWVNSVGHLGKPKRDIEIDGISVPAGTTYTEFAKDYIGKKTEQRGAQQAQQQVPQRSYMKYANPAGGQ